MPNQERNVPARPTEGQVAGRKLSPAQAQRGESNQAPRRKVGRPPGARNKPKGILPTEMADQILLAMKDMLPVEHYDYMKGVIREGKAISTKTELDTLILLLSRNLYPALVYESLPSEEPKQDNPDEFFDDDDDPTESTAEKVVKKTVKMPVFRKDVTERLKVLQGLLSLRNQVEKRVEDSRDEDKPIIRIVAGRGIDAARLRVLVGVESVPLAGNADGNGHPTDEARVVSDQIPERSELLSTSEQGETDRVFDSDRSGGIV